jgi:probable addiction module antidote protein
MKPKNDERKVSHDLRVLERLRKDPEFAAEYLKAAMEDDEEPRVLLIALRRITEARGGITEVARIAGVGRESIQRALAGNANPRFSTLSAIARAVGLRLTVERV